MFLLLRFKANFDAALFFAEGLEFAHGAVIGAFVGGLIAEVEGEGVVIECGGFEQPVLEMDGSVHEPVMFGDGLDEAGFGGCFGFVFGGEGIEEALEFGGVFPGEKSKGTGEAVGSRVDGRG